jgi:hypothetical protein
MRFSILAVMLLSACSPPIANPYVVLQDPGVCASACTLYLDMAWLTGRQVHELSGVALCE